MLYIKISIQTVVTTIRRTFLFSIFATAIANPVIKTKNNQKSGFELNILELTKKNARTLEINIIKTK